MFLPLARGNKHVAASFNLKVVFFRDDIYFPPGLHLRNCSVNLHAYIYIWYMFFIDISSWLSLLACFTSKIFISAVNSSTPPGLVLRKSTWSLAHRVPNVYSCRMLPWEMRKPARGNGTRFFFCLGGWLPNMGLVSRICCFFSLTPTN